MMNTPRLNQAIRRGTLRIIANWQHLLKQAKKTSGISPVSQQISQLKQELDRSFPEFGDLNEVIASYNLYRRLNTLQQQINNTEE